MENEDKNRIEPKLPSHPAFCGFDCAACPIYQATLLDDEELKQKLAEKYSAPGRKLMKADIFCKGCRAEKRYLHPFCEECVIRCCALSHDLSLNCGECPDYPCSVILERIPEQSDSRRCMDAVHTRLLKKRV